MYMKYACWRSIYENIENAWQAIEHSEMLFLDIEWGDAIPA
jgi:hypothetical protein